MRSVHLQKAFQASVRVACELRRMVRIWTSSTNIAGAAVQECCAHLWSLACTHWWGAGTGAWHAHDCGLRLRLGRAQHGLVLAVLCSLAIFECAFHGRAALQSTVDLAAGDHLATLDILRLALPQRTPGGLPRGGRWWH